MTDWSGHIDALAIMGILIIFQTGINILLYNKIRKVEQFIKHIRGVY